MHDRRSFQTRFSPIVAPVVAIACTSSLPGRTSQVVSAAPGAPIDCRPPVVRACGPTAIGRLNPCLAGNDEAWHGCLVDQIRPGECGRARFAIKARSSRSRRVLSTP
jgi:hypothetical protein